MTHYLIEFRFHGKAKYELKRLIYELNRKFRISSKRVIPHITLAGPFYTNDEKRLIGDFNNLCSRSSIMRFKVEGFSAFDNSKVIFIYIKPSTELEKFRWSLSQTLQTYCQLRPFDYNKEFDFHATLAMKLPHDKFLRIKDYIQRKQKLNFDQVVIRATLLKGGFILREYDFFLRRPLVRILAKDKKVYSQTLELLKVYFENKFNPEDFIGEPIRIKPKSFFEKIRDKFRKSKIFITSDLHLDHANIIRFCKRPFLNIEEMNKTLINNWNNTISKSDTVYFIGDLAYGRGSKPTDYWLNKLNGKIIFIKGNHDKSSKIKLYDNYIFEYKKVKFFLTHEPNDVPQDWNGWAICGHKHNNSLEEFPFINKNTKRINVSVELTKYRPVDMDEIIKKINE